MKKKVTSILLLMSMILILHQKEFWCFTPQKKEIKEKENKLADADVISDNALRYSTPEFSQEIELPDKPIQKKPFFSLEKTAPVTLSWEEIQRLPKQDRPDLAMAQNYEMTVDPGLKRIPTERYITARNKIKKYFSQKAAISNVTWEERGPDNVGGRTRALMYDPNDSNKRKVWAGGVAGGLWFNNDITNSSASWQKVDDFWDNMAVSTVAYDPANTQTFYVGTGEGFFNGDATRGNGIWKSTDGGSTWNQLSATGGDNRFYYIQKIVVTNNSTILAATRSYTGTQGGILRSTNGGASWVRELTGRGADLEVAANGDVYASLGIFSNGEIYRSTNNGNTWANVTPLGGSPQRVELAIAPSASSVTASTVIYAVASNSNNNVGWFKKSTNGGSSWSNLTIPSYTNQSCFTSSNDFTRGQAWYDLILAVHPTNANFVVAGGIDLHRSTNGGSNWSSISYWTGNCDDYVHADQHAIVFNPNADGQLIVGNDGGVSYTANVGASNPDFNTRNNGYNVTQFYTVATKNEDGSNYFMAGTQDNGTHQFTSAGVNSTEDQTGGDGAFCFIDQDNSSIQIASHTYNSYYLSTNDWASFSTLVFNTQKGRFINPADYDDTENILYSAGNADELMRISNLAGTPSAQSSLSVGIGEGIISAIKANNHTSNRIFVGTGQGGIYRIDNADGTPDVTNIGTGISGTYYVSSIDVGASDDEIVVTFSNFGVTSVYYTSNGGATWVSKDAGGHGLSDIPVRWALFNPENTKEVLLATDLGVWSTQDITASNPGWEPTNQGLANVRCDMLQYRTADKQVVVATHGRGLFTTNVFGNSAGVNFSASPLVTYTNQDITFTDQSNQAASWVWDFGTDASPASAGTQGAHTVRYSSSGKKTVTLTVEDNESRNARETKVDYIHILPDVNLPYTVSDGGNFEEATNFAALTDAGTGFVRGESTISGKEGVNSGSSAWVTGLTTNYVNNTEAYVVTPNFNFSSSASYFLQFDAKFATEKNYDGFIVEYSTDKGNTWLQLGDSEASNWYNTTKAQDGGAETGGFTSGTPMFSGTVSGYTTFYYDVSSLAGQSDVAFRFAFQTDGSVTGTGVAIDNFRITEEVQFDDPVSGTLKADFAAVPFVAYINQDIIFTDQSVDASSWDWGFGTDASPASAGTQGAHTVRYSASGRKTITLSIENDLNETTTKTKTEYVQVLPDAAVPYSFLQGGNFEETANFAAMTVSGTGFAQGNSAVSGKDGVRSGENAWVTGLTGNYEDNTETYLLTPNFDFSSATNYFVRFEAKFSTEEDFDGFIMEYSTDRGSSWTQLGSSEQDNWYNTTKKLDSGTETGGFVANTPMFGGTVAAYTNFFYDVSSLAGREEVAFRFVFKSDAVINNAGVAIDNFSIVEEENVTALNEPLEASLIQLYPNPSRKTLQLNLNAMPAIRKRLTLYNSLGKVLREEQLEKDRKFVQWNVSSLPKGHYLIKIQTDNGQIFKTFIKN